MKEPNSMIARALPLLGLGLILAVATATPAQAQTSSHPYSWTSAGEPAAAPAPPEAPQAPATPRTPPAPPVASAPAAPAAPASPSAAIAQAPAAPAAPRPPAAVAGIAPPAPRPLGQMINVKIDVVLSDSKGAPKTLSMTVADGESAMNRTTTAGGSADFSFNADVQPLVSGNRIRLRITADAVVPTDSEPKNGNRLGLRQSQTIILNDGDSAEIARAADPVSDRSFTLTVKASIIR